MRRIFIIALTLLSWAEGRARSLEPARKSQLRETIFVTDYVDDSPGYISLHREVAELGNEDKEKAALLRKWLDSKKWLKGRKNSVPAIQSLASIAIAVDGDSGYSLTLMEDKRTIVVHSGTLSKGRFRQRSEGDLYSYRDDEVGAILFGIFSKHYPSCVAVAAEFDEMQRKWREDKERTKQKAKEANFGDK